MLPIGHVGVTLGALTLARVKTNTGLVVAGVLMPDLIDKPLGLLLFRSQFDSGRIFGHTLIFLVALSLFGFTWHYKSQSSAVLCFAAGVALHLIQDQMWRIPEVLLWPTYGLTFPARDYSLALILDKLVTDPATYIPEIVGVAGIALFVYHLHSRGKLYEAMKRVMDFAAALCGLVILLPLSLLISIVIWLQDLGPVFFTQSRCGKGMSRFKLIKFRTMKVPQDREKHKIINLEHDPRVTRIGGLLRSIGLDSIPELINVLKGDISLVGPRAMPWEIEDEPGFTNIGQVPGIDIRSSVIPGMTGVAQVYASKYSDRRTKYRYDAVYVKRRSIWLDIRLFLYSLWLTLKRAWD